MSRRTSHRYLLFYLSVSAILICGSSRGIPRRAFCPSCNQDYPEDLVSPWYPDKSLNPQTKNLPDFDVIPIENSHDFHAQRETVPQNILHDDSILLNQNRPISEKYRNFSPQKSERWYPYTDTLAARQFVNKPKQENLSSNDNLNEYSESEFNRQRLFLREDSENKYPLSPVVPSNLLYSKSGHENLSFRSIRNKYSESSKDRNFEDYPKDEKNPANKLLFYRIDRSPSWKISEDISSNIMSSEESLIDFSQENDILDEESSEIKKSTSSVNQPQYTSAYSQEDEADHYLIGPDILESNHDSHIVLENLNISKPAKEKLFDDWDFIISKYLSRFLDLKDSGEIGNNFLRTYSVKEMEMSTEDNDEQIDNNRYILPQDLTIRELLKNRESFNTWNLAAGEDSQEIIEQSNIKDNLLQEYPVLEENMKNIENKENENMKYLENKNKKDMIVIKNDTSSKAELTNYNSYSSSENPNIWTIINDKALLDRRNFTMNNDWQEIQNAKLYAVKKNDDKYSHDENRKNVTESNTHSQMEQIISTPQINYNPYILSKYLNILNTVNHPADFPRIGTSLKVESNTMNPEQTENGRFFKDEIIQNDANQDIALPKDNFNACEDDELSTNIQLSKREQDKLSMKLDPALINDIENPPTQSTESILIKSL